MTRWLSALGRRELANVVMLRDDAAGADTLLDRAIAIGELHCARGRALPLLPEAPRLKADNLRRAGRPVSEWLPVARRGLAIVENDLGGRLPNYAVHLLVVALGEERASDHAAARRMARRSMEVAKRQGREEVAWWAASTLGRLAEREGRLEDRYS